MNRLVSIIIPTYNRAHLIGETLDSILAQTYSNWECLIVDDGSVDNTEYIVSKYIKTDRRFQFYKRPLEKLKGPSACRNIGLKNALGEFVVFLDSDDLLAPYCLEQRIAFASENLNNDFWIFKSHFFLNDIRENNKIFNSLDGSEELILERFLLGKFPFYVMSPLWLKNKLDSISGFDESLIVFEDPDLHIRAYEIGMNSKVASELVIDSFYRVSNTKDKLSVSSKILEAKFESICRFYEKHSKKHFANIRKNALDFYRSSIYENANFQISFKFYTRFITLNMFSTKQILLVPMLLILKFLRMDKLKRIGLYRFTKYVFES
jgi:glycosyltransferase involved in cell wall biosynthesis